VLSTELKGIVHPKITILSLLIQVWKKIKGQWLLFFFSSVKHTKKDILKNVGNQTPIDFHSRKIILWKSMAAVKCLIHSSKYLFLCSNSEVCKFTIFGG